MRLTPPEKMILVMLADIQEKLGEGWNLDPNLVKEAVYSDQTWALDEWSDLMGFEPEPSPPHVDAVMDTLLMWEVLEEDFDKLTAADQKAAVEAGDWGSKDVKFPGWDGNHESEYRASARFMVEVLKRFTHFAGRGMNSHMASVDRYAAMWRVFKPMRGQLSSTPLSAEQIGSILLAWRS